MSGESLVTEIISTVSLPEPRPMSAKFPSAPLASIVMLSGAVTLGAVVSTTVTVWVAVAELPDESVAVHVITVSPSGNVSGESLVIVSTWIISYIVASPISTTIFKMPVASTITSEGATTSGMVVSIIVTIWMPFEILPDVSTAVHVIVVLPNENESGLSLVTDSIST